MRQILRPGQLFALLTVAGVWQIVCLPEQARGVMGYAGALAIQVLLLIPAMLLIGQGRPFEDVIERKKPIGWTMIGYCILWGARTLTQLRTAVPTRMQTVPGRGTTAVLLLVTVLYTATIGIRAAGRSAPPVLAVALVSAIVLTVGAWRRADLDALTLRVDVPAAAAYVAGTGEAALLWPLAGRTGRGAVRAGMAYLAVRCLLCVGMTVLCLTAGGRLTQGAYPFFTLAALSQPLQGQRADALFILVFMMLAVMQLTLFAGTAAHLARVMHPRLRGTAAAALAGMLLLTLLPADVIETAATSLLPAAAGLLPAATLAAAASRRRAVA